MYTDYKKKESHSLRRDEINPIWAQHAFFTKHQRKPNGY